MRERAGTDWINVADAMSEMARLDPDREAVVFPRSGPDARLSFGALDRLSESFAAGFERAGLGPGDRTLVFIPPGPELIATVFGLLKMGGVPVLVDPGLPREDMLTCIREAAPAGFVGIPLAQCARRLFPGAFRSVRVSVTACRSALIPGLTLARMREGGARRAPVHVSADDVAAIAFTSGSTGIPKGVVYTHGNFRAQVDVMRDDMGISPGDVHLACVHIFALFNPALGVTTVVPEMDPRRPAAVDPARLVRAMQAHRVTFSLGSPTIWRAVADYCQAREARLESVSKIYMFGAPVMPSLVRKMKDCLADGEVFTPYGATEALPLTLIAGAELLEGAPAPAVAGVCVGCAIGGAEIRVIAIRDEPIPNWDQVQLLPPGEVGEVVVRGRVVTREYLNRPDQTAASKIRDGRDLWHRMGDLGYLDDRKRLWFLGRKSHRVETRDGMMLPIPCEAVFNQHPRVARCALVGVGTAGQQEPLLVVEPKPKQAPRSADDQAEFIEQLLELGRVHPHTRPIRRVLFHDSFPMDVRHNAKIQRERLAAWAERDST